MQRMLTLTAKLGLVAATVWVTTAFGNDDSAALALESDTSSSEKAPKNLKLVIEGAFGQASRRYQLGSRQVHRESIDLSYSTQVGPGLRAVFSNRLDHVHPVLPGRDSSINSLREAYLSWQADGGATVVEVGRVNLRFGPAYGYNPTDYFRGGTLRTFTTADPVALRENRLGSVMIRGQRLWEDGSLSAVFSPKLQSLPSLRGGSLDLGSTNSRDRGLLVLGSKLSQSVSSQFFVYKEAGFDVSLGANFTALVSDSAVAHFEWSTGKEPSLISRVTGANNGTAQRNRLAGGLTYTTASKLSFTAEYLYNGFALDKAGWSGLTGVAGAQPAYLNEALRLMELAPRQSVLLYASQKNVGIKNLHLTAFLRLNLEDQSRLAWVELRHQWSSFDLAFQLQQTMGRANSEFGILPDRRIMQIVGTYFF